MSLLDGIWYSFKIVSFHALQSTLLLNFITFSGKDSNARNMGKKGSWFSAIKRVFTPHSKAKLVNVSG